MELVNEIQREPDDPRGTLRCRDGGPACCSRMRCTSPRSCGSVSATSGCGSSPGPRPIRGTLERDIFELVVQVNGKVRDRLEVATNLSDDELVARAKASPRGRALLERQGDPPDRSSSRASSSTWSSGSQLGFVSACGCAQHARSPRVKLLRSRHTFAESVCHFDYLQGLPVSRRRSSPSPPCFLTRAGSRRPPAGRYRSRRVEPLRAVAPTASAPRPGCSSFTSSAPCAGRGSTVFRKGRGSTMRCIEPAELPAADLALVNLAAPLADGPQVVVPRRAPGFQAAGRDSDSADRRGRSTSTQRRWNSSTRFPGSGPVTAQKILDYRSSTLRPWTTSTRSSESAHPPGAART